MRDHTLYRITAQVLTTDGDWGGSRQVPTFYLDSAIQGITDERHACEIARGIIDPMGRLNVNVSAESRTVSVSI